MKPLSERLQELINSRCFMVGMYEDDQKAVMDALALAKSVETAATGECMEVGDLTDCDGNRFVGAIIESTPAELRKGPPIVYRRVALVPLPQQSET